MSQEIIERRMKERFTDRFTEKDRIGVLEAEVKDLKYTVLKMLGEHRDIKKDVEYLRSQLKHLRTLVGSTGVEIY